VFSTATSWGVIWGSEILWQGWVCLEGAEAQGVQGQSLGDESRTLSLR
jgi:hypothetical protein